MNAKGDYEGFRNSAGDLGRRTPLVSRSSLNSNQVENDGYIGAQAQQQETFEFDSSEVGAAAMYGNFEEYTGPSLNEFQKREEKKAEEEPNAF